MPGQIGKFPLLLAQMSMQDNGLNRLACIKTVRYTLVGVYWMAMQSRLCGVLVIWADGGGFEDRRLSRGCWCSFIGR